MSESRDNYLCDSVFVAIAIRLLSKRAACPQIIYELKPYDKGQAFINLMRMILDDRRDNYAVINVPSPWNLISRKNPISTIRNLRLFYGQVSSLISFNEEGNYYGTVTSSLLFCAPNNVRRYIDHGVDEPARRFGKRTLSKRYSRSLANKLQGILGTPPFDDEYKRVGYTPALFHDDHYKHIDFSGYELEGDLAQSLGRLQGLSSGTVSNVIALMSSGWDGIRVSGTFNEDYWEANFKLIKENTSDEETIFIKFHRNLYFSDFESAHFIEFCKGRGLNLIDIDKFIPSTLRGQIPVELLIRPLRVSRVFGELSGAFFSLAHFKGLQIIMNPRVAWHLRSPRERGFIQASLQLNERLVHPFEINNSN